MMYWWGAPLQTWGWFPLLLRPPALHPQHSQQPTTKGLEMSDAPENIIALRVDYRKINPQCYVCGGESKVVRCTQATDGEVYISTLCEKHARGEQEHIVADGEMENVEGTGTFINLTLCEKLAESGAIETLGAAMEEELERKKGTDG